MHFYCIIARHISRFGELKKGNRTRTEGNEGSKGDKGERRREFEQKAAKEAKENKEGEQDMNRR